MIVSEKSITIKANSMRLLLSAAFTLGAVVSIFDSALTQDQISEITASEEIARIDETPDRHDASGGSMSTQVFSPAVTA